MTNVLNTLLEITLFSAVILAAILLFQRLFRRRISAAMGYAVWALLILRLIIPVTIDSDFHVFTVPQEPVAQMAYADEVPATSNIEAPTNSLPILSASEKVQSGTPTSKSMIPTANLDSHAPSKSLNWSTIIVLIWAAGILGFFAHTAVQWIRLNRKIKRGGTVAPAFVDDMVNALKKDVGIRADIKVSVQDWLLSPALSASLKPTLLLPKSMLQNGASEALLFSIRHELMHYKRKDHIVSLLLMALRCVYWFNPVVWLAFRRIQADMETACDAAVTARMTGNERTRYIHTMIDLGSDAAPLYALGMGCGQGRKALEKRVRGIFMTRRTKPTARMAAGLLALLLFVACFTTACQPTPEEPIVIGKGDGLDDLIQATPSASSIASPSESTLDNDALYTKLAVPKHWSFETTALADKLNITADVDIELPGVSQLPAATASLSAFTQEDLDKIAEVLGVGDATWTEINNEMTKEEIGDYLIGRRADLERVKAEEPNNSEAIENIGASIEYYEKHYMDAPDKIELENIEFKICEGEEVGFYDEVVTCYGFHGITQVDGQPFELYASSGYNSDKVRMIWANFNSFHGARVDEPYGVSLTKEQAVKQASEIAAQLTDELTLCCAAPAAAFIQEGGSSRNWGWACVFMREINGCPTAYATTDVGSSMEGEVREPIRYEKMVIVMDDMGMVSFNWETPMTIESIDNPDVTLLSFDKIAQRAAAQIGQYWAYNAIEAKSMSGEDMSDPGCTAIITKVELGLMRVAKADSDDYYYIPVWNFFTDLEHTDDYWERTGKEPYSQDEDDVVDEDGNPRCPLFDGYGSDGAPVTINALDGSVIDRDLGY